jgi:hypothetical protein
MHPLAITTTPQREALFNTGSQIEQIYLSSSVGENSETLEFIYGRFGSPNKNGTSTGRKYAGLIRITTLLL